MILVSGLLPASKSSAAAPMRLRAFASDTTVSTPPPTTTLKWPPPRSQLIRMADPDADYDESEGVMTASGRGVEYHDDHHFVGEGFSASLSPHHDGYEHVGSRLDTAARVRLLYDLC